MDMKLSCLLKAQRKRRVLRYNFLNHKIKEKSSSEVPEKGRNKKIKVLWMNFTVKDFNH